MTTKPTLTTEDRSIALVPTVDHLRDGIYSVACQSLDGWFYLVWPRTSTQPARCQCEHSRRHPGERCKHIWAVRKKLEQDRKPAF
jgi:hypothetical protein